MQSKQILLTLVAFAFALAHANPLAASQDTSAKLPCTYTEYVGGPRVRDETHAKEVTTTIDSRWKCVYAAYLLDFCGTSTTLFFFVALSE